MKTRKQNIIAEDFSNEDKVELIQKLPNEILCRVFKFIN